MSKKMDRCSFCGRTEREVTQLFQGPGDVFICDSCVESCHSLLRDDMYSLAKEYENHPFKIMSLEEYTEVLINCLKIIRGK